MSDLHLGYTYTSKTNAQGINWREVDGYRAMDECVSQIIADGSIDVVVPCVRTASAGDHLRPASASQIRGCGHTRVFHCRQS